MRCHFFKSVGKYSAALSLSFGERRVVTYHANLYGFYGPGGMGKGRDEGACMMVI